MEKMQEFSIIDPKGMNTVAFAIQNDFGENNEEVFIIKMLKNEQENEDGKTKKTFYIDVNVKEKVTVLLLSLGKDKIVLNSGVLENNEIEIIKKPETVKYEPIINEGDKNQYRDFKYTPNLGRSISIVDTYSGEEIKPSIYIDTETNEIVGKCKLMPYRSYVAIEVVK